MARGGARAVVTASVLTVSALGLVGCSSPKKVTPAATRTQNDLVACASVDAVFGLISHHKEVPATIAQRVITSGVSADNADLQAEAKALRSAVAKANQGGVDQDISSLGTTCDSLGVGPAKY